MSNKRPKIVVVGGGFAGIVFCKQMSNKECDILLIDQYNHHQFQPLFYQVACSMLEPTSISFPFRQIFRKSKNMKYHMAKLEKVFPDQNYIETNIGNFSYDYLVVSMGCKTNFFGNKLMEEHALTLKSTHDSINVRNHILSNFEKVITLPVEEQEPYLNMVIVGAGPTGVELAGSFAEMKNTILPKDYTHYDFSKLKIYLVENSPHTLNAMSDNARSASENYLKELGVIIKTSVAVDSYDGNTCVLGNGEVIPTKNFIWSAGVIANEVTGLDNAEKKRGNRIYVDDYNRVKGYDNVFAVGDISYMDTDPNYKNSHPQLANVAINQAKNLSKNLLTSWDGKSWKEFRYKDLGSMATVGKNKAVVDLPKFKFKGFFAWMVWMFLHLMLILNVRNRIIILINWAVSYFTSGNSSLRIILNAKDDKK